MKKSSSDTVLKSVKSHFTILYILLVAAVVLTGLQFAAVSQDSSDDFSWECIQTSCADYMSEGEIVDSVCSQYNGTYVCDVNVDGESRQVPLAQLNLSSLRFCDEYTCVKEARVRSVNYTLNDSAVSPRN